MDRTAILTAALIVLVVFGVVQVVQVNALKERISGGTLVTGSSQSFGGQPSSASSALANLQNLPDMVGGC